MVTGIAKEELPSMNAVLSQCFNLADAISSKLDQIHPWEEVVTPPTEAQQNVSSLVGSLESNLRRVIALANRLEKIDEHTQRIVGKLNDRL